jgi:hypothetical protein
MRSKNYLEFFLNDYLFSIITDYLCIKDLIKFSLNCNKKLKLMLSHITNRHFIDNIYVFDFFNSLYRLDESFLFKNVKILDFSQQYYYTKDLILNIIKRSPNLISIDFTNIVIVANSKIVQENLPYLVNPIDSALTTDSDRCKFIPIDDVIDYICLNFKNIKKFSIFNIECTIESVIKIINTYDKLEEFKIYGGRDNLIIDDYLVKQLYKFKNTIKNLCFEYCSEITSESLIPFLSNNSTLKSLDITSCLKLDNTIIKTLVQNNMYQLTELTINDELFEKELIDQLKLKYSNLKIIYSNMYQDNYYDDDDYQSVDSDDRWSHPSYLGWVDDYYD